MPKPLDPSNPFKTRFARSTFAYILNRIIDPANHADIDHYYQLLEQTLVNFSLAPHVTPLDVAKHFAPLQCPTCTYIHPYSLSKHSHHEYASKYDLSPPRYPHPSWRTKAKKRRFIALRLPAKPIDNFFDI